MKVKRFTKKIIFYLNQQTFDKLLRLAEREGLSLSSYIRMLIQAVLQEKEKR